MNNRKFGVEIELLTPPEWSPNQYTWEAIQGVVMGFLASNKINLWNGNRPEESGWKVVYDGSIRDNEDGNRSTERLGYEVVSPVLEGSEGLAEIRKVVRVLTKMGCVVNATCGLHVHVDVSDFNGWELTAALQRYQKMEHMIDRYMPASRRGNSSEYARSVHEMYLNGARSNRLAGLAYSADTPEKAKNYVHSTWGRDYRYCKLNLHAVAKHGTLEFRQHHATMDPKTISHWVQFCTNFVERTKKLYKAESVPERPEQQGLTWREFSSIPDEHKPEPGSIEHVVHKALITCFNIRSGHRELEHVGFRLLNVILGIHEDDDCDIVLRSFFTEEERNGRMRPGTEAYWEAYNTPESGLTCGDAPYFFEHNYEWFKNKFEPVVKACLDQLQENGYINSYEYVSHREIRVHKAPVVLPLPEITKDGDNLFTGLTPNVKKTFELMLRTA